MLIDQMVDTNTQDGTGFTIQEPKVGLDNAGGLALAYLRRTDVAPSYPTHGATDIYLMAGTGGGRATPRSRTRSWTAATAPSLNTPAT